MSLWRLEAWSVSVWLPTLNKDHEELLCSVAKAAGEIVSSENPTADTAMMRFNFIMGYLSINVRRNLTENINGYGSWQ
jgi:hypothetical protein